MEEVGTRMSPGEAGTYRLLGVLGMRMLEEGAGSRLREVAESHMLPEHSMSPLTEASEHSSTTSGIHDSGMQKRGIRLVLSPEEH